MIFCIDIDGVIFKENDTGDYTIVEPIQANIDVINRLYDKGHEVRLYTARGSKTGLDWTEKTIQQLEEYKVKYDSIAFGKPYADYYIDDKFISIDIAKRIV